MVRGGSKSRRNRAKKNMDGVKMKRVKKVTGSRVSVIRAGALTGARLEALAFLSARRMTLGLAVLGIFIEHYAGKDMRQTGDGSLIGALLHTCTYTRYRAALLFEPIRMREVAPPPPNKQHVLYKDPRLVKYMMKAVPSFFVDWSIERYETQSPSVKICADALRTESGLRGESAECAIRIILDEVPLASGESESAGSLGKRTTVKGNGHELNFATVQEGCEVLQDSLAHAWDARFDKEWMKELALPSAPFIRFASPHHRARMGSLEAPPSGARVRVEYWLYHLENEPDDKVMGNRSWLFETLKAGDEHA